MPDADGILPAEEVAARRPPLEADATPIGRDWVEYANVLAETCERLREQRDEAQRERGRLLYAIAQITPIAEAEAADRWRSANTTKLDAAEAKVAQAKAALGNLLRNAEKGRPISAVELLVLRSLLEQEPDA